MSAFDDTFRDDQYNSIAKVTQEKFQTLIQKDQYVGEIYSISYETAIVQIHDFHRQEVGGIPSLSFLIATRVDPDQISNINLEKENKENQASEIDDYYKTEDASVILLRVMDAAPLPNAMEAERIRSEAAQRASGEDIHWDSPGMMDSSTHQLLSFAGVKCRVIGTFFLDQNNNSEASDDLLLRFGCDISNYYPNRGLKVYKPNNIALNQIVNYRDRSRTDLQSSKTVTIGQIRYASTNRSFQGISNVNIDILPADLLGQKTAIFGMTRTGKSNTTKIILQSIFNLRFNDDNQGDTLRIGQIVFDPNGEYANENVQDSNNEKNPSAIKNLWRFNPHGKQEDVVTYGILKHPNDPDRILMLLNFYTDENLQIGKEIIDSILAQDSSKYIQNFCQVVFEKPDTSDHSAMARYNRRVLVYRALLNKAGFIIPKNLKALTSKLFNKRLIDALEKSAMKEEVDRNGQISFNLDNQDYLSAAKILKKNQPEWSELAKAFEILYDFMNAKEYKDFENWYITERPKASGDSWADEDLKKLLAMFIYPNGARQIGKVRNQHTPSTSSDYAKDIYEHLKNGKLVIIDQSSGDPEINQSSANRIMWQIFRENQSLFREGKNPPNILVYLEEAHNLLPAGTDMDLKDVWVRTAKEGAKYQIGMIYATQEVSR